MIAIIVVIILILIIVILYKMINDKLIHIELNDDGFFENSNKIEIIGEVIRNKIQQKEEMEVDEETNEPISFLSFYDEFSEHEDENVIDYDPYKDEYESSDDNNYESIIDENYKSNVSGEFEN